MTLLDSSFLHVERYRRAPTLIRNKDGIPIHRLATDAFLRSDQRSGLDPVRLSQRLDHERGSNWEGICLCGCLHLGASALSNTYATVPTHLSRNLACPVRRSICRRTMQVPHFLHVDHMHPELFQTTMYANWPRETQNPRLCRILGGSFTFCKDEKQGQKATLNDQTQKSLLGSVIRHANGW